MLDKIKILFQNRQNAAKFFICVLTIIIVLIPLILQNTSASAIEVLQLYFDYLKIFEYSKACFLFSDSYKQRNGITSRFLYNPETPFADRVWSILEINFQKENRIKKKQMEYKVEIIDYLSGKMVFADIILVKNKRRWEIESLEYSPIQKLNL